MVRARLGPGCLPTGKPNPDLQQRLGLQLEYVSHIGKQVIIIATITGIIMTSLRSRLIRSVKDEEISSASAKDPLVAYLQGRSTKQRFILS